MHKLLFFVLAAVLVVVVVHWWRRWWWPGYQDSSRDMRHIFFLVSLCGRYELCTRFKGTKNWILIIRPVRDMIHRPIRQSVSQSAFFGQGNLGICEQCEPHYHQLVIINSSSSPRHHQLVIINSSLSTCHNHFVIIISSSSTHHHWLIIIISSSSSRHHQLIIYSSSTHHKKHFQTI